MPRNSLLLSAVALAAFALNVPSPAAGQIIVNIGPAPICPYGYFDYAPYDCAPYGYYGPDWFVGGVFLGAGPWFHGPRGFAGHVDNRYDPHHGYHGPLPSRGAAPFNHFQPNEARDGRGHTAPATHAPTNEHSAGFSGASHPGGGGGHPSGGAHPSGGHPR
ncbi:MAG TPA: hypothetical protein VHY48_06600 [Acidobacteriaceae bacterium]|nr:hypothetical protein [Acidobacteriaceae bacterium]